MEVSVAEMMVCVAVHQDGWVLVVQKCVLKDTMAIIACNSANARMTITYVMPYLDAFVNMVMEEKTVRYV